MTNGIKFSIEQIAENLESVFIEPNSQVMADLVSAGYWKKAKARGYTLEMIPVIPNSAYGHLRPDKNQVEVAERLQLYETSTGACFDVYHIGNHLEDFYVNDNPTLIADLNKHNFTSVLIRLKIMPDTLYGLGRKTFNVSDVGENLDSIEFPKDDKELINSLIKIGYRNKLIELGYIQADYVANSSDSDSDSDPSRRPEYNLKKAKPKTIISRKVENARAIISKQHSKPKASALQSKTPKETRPTKGGKAPKSFSCAALQSKTAKEKRPTKGGKAPKSFSHSIIEAYNDGSKSATGSKKGKKAKAAKKPKQTRPRKKKNFIAKGGIRKPKR